MSKMHELLAVEGDLQKRFQETAKETKEVFSKKPEHFRGHVKTLKMKSEERQFEEDAAAEYKEVTSTVGEKLKYTADVASKYFNALLQKEDANQKAKADLVVDGQIIAENLPATFLLAMEARLKLVREYYTNIPTLSPGTSWVKDDGQRNGVFVTEHPDVREKTEKDVAFRVAAEATENHPAQIAQQGVTNVVGLFTTKTWCGMISPSEKSDLLGRIDTMYQAVKQARTRANQVEVDGTLNIGQKLFDYISSGEL